jgi:signal transduction histidine kinase
MGVRFQFPQQAFKRITRSVFHKGTYDPQDLLERMSQIVVANLELDTLAKEVLHELTATLGLKCGAILLGKRNSLDRVIDYKFDANNINLSIEELNFLLSQRKSLVISGNLKAGKLKELMNNNNLEALVRLSVGGKKSALLVLGSKADGGSYTDNDIWVLEKLASQLVDGIQASLKYEGMKQLNKKLRAEVKKIKADYKVTNERLKEMDRQKDEFISMAAHELRAPTTAIKGYISMIMEGDAGEVSVKTRDFLGEANAINNRVIRLVNNMLNVSRIEKGRMVYQMDVVKLSEVAKKVYESFKIEAERKALRYLFKVPAKIKDGVYVDSDRIHEVVGNLVSNAIKYTPGGSVTLELSQPDKRTVRLEVIDTGPGISKAEQKRLFRKFYRVKSTVGKTIGTGLGLYISKLLVQKFNGEIGIESEVDKGSTFWIELPVTKRKPKKAKPKSR